MKATKNFGRTAVLALSALGLVLIFTSCKPKNVFLETNRVQLDTSGVALKQVQFYNDKAIILRRKAQTDGEVSESGGRMIEVDGEAVQEILIKKGTPGVITGEQNGKYLVRFERGDGKVIRFYKNSKGAFQIDADKWVNRKGLITYAGLDFIIEEESNDCLLMFRENKRFSSTSEMKTAKGLKIKPK
ncbi:MAG: hypothetical protein U0176_25950 [Bacteroidia bacterium]